MKKGAVLVILTVLSIGFIVHAAEEKKADTKKQTHCPVMERYEIDKNVYVDVKGKRIYTCCKGCINQIKANPDKYIQHLRDKGVTIEKAPTQDDTNRK